MNHGKYVFSQLVEVLSQRVFDRLETKYQGNIYAFDSSTIDLWLSVFWWAHFRKTKAGI